MTTVLVRLLLVLLVALLVSLRLGWGCVGGSAASWRDLLSIPWLRWLHLLLSRSIWGWWNIFAATPPLTHTYWLVMNITTWMFALHHAPIHFTVFSLCITLLHLLLLIAALVLLMGGSTVSLLLGKHVCAYFLGMVKLVLNFGLRLSGRINIIVAERCIYLGCASTWLAVTGQFPLKLHWITLIYLRLKFHLLGCMVRFVILSRILSDIHTILSIVARVSLDNLRLVQQTLTLVLLLPMMDLSMSSHWVSCWSSWAMTGDEGFIEMRAFLR